MPTVPYRADLGYTQGSIGTRVSPDHSGSESIGRFAESFRGATDSLIKYEEAKKEELRKLKEQMGKNYMRQESAANLRKAYAGSASSEDILPTFTKLQQDSINNYLKQEKDEGERAYLEGSLNQVSSEHYDTAFQISVQAGKAEVEKGHLEAQNSASAQAERDPYNAKKYAQEYDTLVGTSTMPDMAKASASFAGKKSIAEGAITGFLKGGKYNDAHDIVKSFGGHFTEDERAKLTEKINKQRNRDYDVQSKEEFNSDRRILLDVKRTQEQTFENELQLLEKINDPNAEGAAASLQTRAESIDAALAREDLSLDQATILRAIVQQDVVESDPKYRAHLWGKLLAKETDGLSSEVGSAVATKKIPAREAVLMLKEIKAIESKRGPAKNLSESDKITRAIVDRIPSIVQHPDYRRMKYPLTAEEEELRSKIEVRMYENMRNPKFGGDPELAFEDARATYMKTKRSPRLAALKGQTAREKMLEVENAYQRKDGTMSAKDRVDLLRILKELSAEEQKTSRGKK